MATDIYGGVTAAGNTVSDPILQVAPATPKQSDSFNWGQGLGTVAGMTAAGGEIGGPWGAAAGAVVGVGVDLVSYFSNKADVTRANAKAQEIDAATQKKQDELNAFSENMQKQQMQFAKDQFNFGKLQTTAGNVNNVNQSMIQKLTDTINNNESLKNMVIQRYKAA